MKRTKNNLPALYNANQLRTFASAVVSRLSLASKMGAQYDGNRDLYKALGYPTTEPNFKDYLNRYQRQDIAKAVIDRPVVATWQGPLELIETDDAEETEFEEAWRKLNRRLDIKSVFARVDRLTGLGKYGVILLGLDDVRDSTGFMNPVRSGKRILKYLKPFGESTARISTYEINPRNERYGLPFMYEVEIADSASGRSQTIQVHYSRIIHITDNSLESEVFGTPRLRAIYNRLMDMDKIAGGDAEMFWRNARPGYQGLIDKDYTITPEAEEEFMDQIDEFENNLRRILINEGITLKELTQQISDPKNHADVILTLISAETGIPKRILSGSERGELASTQDVGEWKTYIKTRREDHAEPRIVRPTIDRFMELGILPMVEDEYNIDWADLFAMSELERVEIGKNRANALREYTYNPLEQAIVPPKGFLQEFLGFSRQQIELMEQMKEDDMLEEMKTILELQNGVTEGQSQVAEGQSQGRGQRRLEAAQRTKTLKRTR